MTRRSRTGSTTSPTCRPSDIFVIASNSGVNGSIVELAQLVKQHGHRLIAITSFTQTAGVDSRHPSGTKLIDHADVALDNGAPYGDAVLPLPGGGTVCAVSSITGALVAQLIGAEVVRRLTEAGETPPVYLSANVPGGDEHNSSPRSPLRRPDPSYGLTVPPAHRPGRQTP